MRLRTTTTPTRQACQRDAGNPAVTTIAIAPPPQGKPAGNVETGISLHTEDIDGYHRDLKAQGVDVDPDVSRMGGPVPPLFWFRDPEGNTLMVVGDT